MGLSAISAAPKQSANFAKAACMAPPGPFAAKAYLPSLGSEPFGLALFFGVRLKTKDALRGGGKVEEQGLAAHCQQIAGAAENAQQRRDADQAQRGRHPGLRRALLGRLLSPQTVNDLALLCHDLALPKC